MTKKINTARKYSVRLSGSLIIAIGALAKHPEDTVEDLLRKLLGMEPYTGRAKPTSAQLLFERSRRYHVDAEEVEKQKKLEEECNNAMTSSHDYINEWDEEKGKVVTKPVKKAAKQPEKDTMII